MGAFIDVDERIAKCQKILADNSESLIFAALSDAYRKKGDLAKAFHICSRGLKLHLDYGPGHLVMAKINCERGLYSEAEKELSLAEQTDGKTRATELLQAQILIKKGETKEAKKTLEKLKSTDPENPLIRELLETIKQGADLGKPDYDAMLIDERWHIGRVVDLRDAVAYLKSLPGVVGALVVGEDGLVAESRLGSNLNRETVGAMVVDVIRNVEEGLSAIGFGRYERILVEIESLELWTIRFNHQAFVVCYSPDINLGGLKVRVEELLEHLAKSLT
ncbi:MAG: hypothetical protein WCE90_01165 [Candidatus Zixiibacteriota bacterium]